MLVLDSNILIRAVLGAKVLALLRRYAGRVQFWAPDVAFLEAREHLPAIVADRGIDPGPVIELLNRVSQVVQTVEEETYSPFQAIARARLQGRDEEDWPVLASAMALGCAIWTENTDFFGCGVATWTTDRIEIYLASVAEAQPE